MGSILIILAGAGLGYYQSHKLSLRVQFLEDYIKLLSFIETEIRYSAVSPVQIIRKYTKRASVLKPMLLAFVKHTEEQMPIAAAWQLAFERVPFDYGLTKDDVYLINEFGKGFGTSDVDGQLSHCKLAADLMDERLTAAREEKKNKSKLYMMLGLFLGIGIVLLF